MSSSLQVDRSQNDALNLQVLQRRDNSIMDILITASHVVMYEFHQQSQQWARSDVEGCLFLVKRFDQPRFQLMVNNRLSMVNLTLTLSSEAQVTSQDKFMILHLVDPNETEGMKVHGIWFYPEEDRDEVCKVVKRAINALRSHDKKKNEIASSKEQKMNSEAGASILNMTLKPSNRANEPCLVPPKTFRRTDSGSSFQGITPRKSNTSNLLMPMSVATAAATRSSRTQSISSSHSSSSLMVPGPPQQKVSPRVSPRVYHQVPSPRASVNKEVLKQSMISLLNDDYFFNQIYNAYIYQLDQQRQ